MKIRFTVRLYKKRKKREVLIAKFVDAKDVCSFYSYREAINDAHSMASDYARFLGATSYSISEEEL